MIALVNAHIKVDLSVLFALDVMFVKFWLATLAQLMRTSIATPTWTAQVTWAVISTARVGSITLTGTVVFIITSSQASYECILAQGIDSSKTFIKSKFVNLPKL